MEQNKAVCGYGQAKIILIGEHAVVYGQPAIAMPLSTIKTQACLKKQAPGIQTINSSYFSGPIKKMPLEMTGINLLIEAILTEHGKIDTGFALSITSQLPAERGMGSSAAVAIAIIRCFYKYFGWTLEHSELLRLANIEEIETHRNPSGLDVATSASSQPIWMIRNKEMLPLPIDMDAYLLICDSGIKGQTSKAIQIVKERLNNNTHITQNHIIALGDLARIAKNQIATNQVVGLGQTFNQAQSHLLALGVSTPTLENFINLSRNNGSLGSKLTGGGQGGCFINLMRNKTDAIKLAEILVKNGVTRTWIQPLSPKEEL